MVRNLFMGLLDHTKLDCTNRGIGFVQRGISMCKFGLIGSYTNRNTHVTWQTQRTNFYCSMLVDYVINLVHWFQKSTVRASTVLALDCTKQNSNWPKSGVPNCNCNECSKLVQGFKPLRRCLWTMEYVNPESSMCYLTSFLNIPIHKSFKLVAHTFNHF